MKDSKKAITLSTLVLSIVISSVFLIKQIYEFRTSNAKVYSLVTSIEELSFHSNILIEDISYYKNQTNILTVAKEKLNMRIPTKSEKILILSEKKT
tara:strand:+ start:149 stop:436 length:288 start_codon:yes stop_codon:yes gene_type:complete